jgi:hypothetical protein
VDGCGSYDVSQVDARVRLPNDGAFGLLPGALMLCAEHADRMRYGYLFVDRPPTLLELHEAGEL